MRHHSIQLSSRWLFSCVLTVSVGLGSLALGCTDKGEADGTTGTGGSSTGGAGGGAMSTTNATTNSTASGSGGGASTGSGGGGDCLPASATAAYFSIESKDLCAVAIYSAAGLDLMPFGISPTWGNQGGPLTGTVDETGAAPVVQIQRWTLSGTTLSATNTLVTTPGVDDSVFFAPALVDLPGGDVAASWTGTDFTTDGAVLFLSEANKKVDATVSVTGVFGLAASGTPGAEFVAYTGLDAMNGGTGSQPGVYLADFTNATFEGCDIDQAWGENTGPLVIDSASNALAIMSSSTDDTQEMRGFTSENVQEAGSTIFTVPGFGSEMTAVAPAGASPGLVLFQPEIGQGTDQDVILAHYTVSGTTIKGETPKTFLKLTTAGTHLTLMTDDKDRVWVGTENLAKGAAGSVFIVLARP